MRAIILMIRAVTCEMSASRTYAGVAARGTQVLPSRRREAANTDESAMRVVHTPARGRARAVRCSVQRAMLPARQCKVLREQPATFCRGAPRQ